jgi:hypothetical protein
VWIKRICLLPQFSIANPTKQRFAGWPTDGVPDKVNVHDFAGKEPGKAIPYGVYGIGANAGCASAGIDHDTAGFAVNAIRPPKTST